MDFRETLNFQDYTKLDKFSKQLEGFERLFRDKDLLEMRQELAKINKDEVVGLCSEINGYKTGFMDALTLLDSEPDLQSLKELFEEWWIDYELKEEYGTSSRKEIAKIMIDDLETSSEDEVKKLSLQEILSLEKRSNDID